MATVIQRKISVKEETDFKKATGSDTFKNLNKEKKKFIVPFTIFFLVFYFTLPILTSYSTILNKPAIGDISWVWIFAVAQFVMTWTFVMIYMKKAVTFDRMAKEIILSETINRGKDK